MHNRRHIILFFVFNLVVTHVCRATNSPEIGLDASVTVNTFINQINTRIDKTNSSYMRCSYELELDKSTSLQKFSEFYYRYKFEELGFALLVPVRIEERFHQFRKLPAEIRVKAIANWSVYTFPDSNILLGIYLPDERAFIAIQSL